MSVLGGRRPVRIVGNPGELIDPAIAPDVQWLRRTFKVRVTDGYSLSDVHAAGGEHPLGLAVDLVPDESLGGTWDDVDRLVKWAEPKQNQPRRPFRWVGYNGDPNHGRGNHAHLSWNHDDQGGVETLFDAQGKPTGIGGTVAAGTNGGGPSVPSAAQQAAGAIPGIGAVAGPIVGAADNAGVLGDVTSAGGDITVGIAKALVNGLADAIGKDGARIVLYVALVGAGAALAVLGITRAAGVKPPTNAAGLATLVATRNPKAAAAAGAATA